MVLEVKYIMDMQDNYLILECNEDSLKSFSSKMILSNRIPGLLKTEIRSIDDKDFFYYNITSNDSLFNIYENRLFGYQALKDILKAIIKTIEDSREYLLEEEDFILKPESVYINKNNEEVLLCYYTSYNIPLLKQFGKLIEYFMNKVDYKDEQAVLLVYALYKITKESNVTFKQIKDELNKNIKNKMPSYINIENSNNEYKIAETLNSNGNDLDKIENKTINGKDIKKGNANNYNNTNHTSCSSEFTSEISDEKEVMIYSKKSYILALISILSVFLLFIIVLRLGLLHNSFGTQIDLIKLLCFIIVTACLEGLFMSKIFHKDNKISKIIPDTRTFDISYGKKEDPYNSFNQDKNFTNNDCEESNNYMTQVVWKNEDKEDYKTEILSDLGGNQSSYYLEPSNLMDDKIYINTSPFIVGNYINGVNYRIEDPSVSRFHARISVNNESISVVDLDSTNGTFINGSKIEAHTSYELYDSDEICFSKCRFILKINFIKKE